MYRHAMAGGVPVSGSAARSGEPSSTNYTVPLVVLTSLFFMWGFLTCLNDILIPHLKAIFQLSYFRAMLIQSAFFIAYAVMSIPSVRIVSRVGHKRTILVGLGTMTIACVMFYPAAARRPFPLFLLPR